MTEQVLSDLYMVDGGAEDADAVLSDDNTTTFKMNKNLLMGLQVFLVILLIFLLFAFKRSFTRWYNHKYHVKHAGRHRGGGRRSHGY